MDIDSIRSSNEDRTDDRVRRGAVETLAQDTSPGTVAQLVAALSDPHWRVRQAAVEGLVRRGGPNTVGEILRAMGAVHDDIGVLNGAIQVLATVGMSTVSALEEFLTGPDTDLRAYAALTLGILGDARAAPMLIRALGDPDTNVRFHAIEALKQLNAGEAVEALAAVAESRDFFLAFPALDALAAIGDPRAAHRIVPLLDDPNLQTAAAEALGHLGDEEAVAPLTTLLNQPACPASVVAVALATLHDRYEKSHRNGKYIANLARLTVSPVGVQNLVGALEHAEKRAVPALATVLGWLRGEAVERVLTRLLGQPAARAEAVEALVGQGTAVTELLMRQLAAEDLDTRHAAIRALGRIGDRRAVPALIAALDANEELAAEVAGSLAIIGDPRAYPPLLRLIGHPNAGVRRAVVAALNSLTHPDTAADMSRLLRDANPLIREAAVRVAGYASCPECADLLLERCHDEDESVRRTAVEHLAYLEDPRAVPVLTGALRDSHSGVRAAAARAAGQVEPAAAAALLGIALADADPWVRYFAARSIAGQECKPLLATLVKLAQADPAVQVRVVSIRAIGRVGGAEVVGFLTPLAADLNPDIGHAALAALGELGHSDALPALRLAAFASESGRRQAALRALGESGLPEAVEILLQAAGDPDGAVAQAAVEALGRLGVAAAVTALIELTAIPKWRAICIDLLFRSAEKHAPVVSDGLNHKNPTVRRSVVEALARAKPPRMADLLAPALADPDGAIRRAAITALAQSPGKARAE